jgi:hypothetical protein
VVLNKYQILKSNTREIDEFPLVKFTKEPAPHQSKDATPQIQRSHYASTKLFAETKTKKTANKYLMYLLLKPKSHRTSSSTQSNM